MIPCPLSGDIGIDYHISQWFGNPRGGYYQRYGMIGHNGIDFVVPIGTPVFAPIDGYITTGDEGNTGYGRFVKIISDSIGQEQNRRRVDLGHLSQFSANAVNGRFVRQGDLVAFSGNSGDSTGPHLHFTFKNLRANGETLNLTNGYKGAIDVSAYIWPLHIDRVLKPLVQ